MKPSKIALLWLGGIVVATIVVVAVAARVNFGGDRLTIEAAGATDMTGEDCRYATLDLSMAGAGNAQFEGIVVTDADVEVAGATNVALTMHGGELTGGLAGAGRIEYSGTVAREAVDIAGFGWVGPATGG